jgi:hypothetical protein
VGKMSQYEKMYLLNFGAKLCDEAVESIKNEVGADNIEQILKKVNLDLSKNPYLQCHDVVLSAKKYLLDSCPCVINLPGLPIACVFIVNEIAALTGREPTIVFTSRNISEAGYFSDFQFKRLFNLSYERTVTRERFKNGDNE